MYVGGATMKRKIEKCLDMWKVKETRLPLLLYGARQIGKTYSLNKWGEENFTHVIYVNFENEPLIAAQFELSLKPDHILNVLCEYRGKSSIDSSNTLIIFDEIQVCEKALTSLKYFAELAPEYYIVAAGSLLGVKINRDKFSFPVGKVQPVNMYPLDFEEFLWALGKKSLCQFIRICYEENKSLPELLHKEALELYRSYLLVGGMPAVVKAYASHNNYSEIQDLIYSTYVADMAKYTSRGESIHIHEAYDSLPAQLAKDNKKFQYKLIRQGGRSSLYGPSIDWLVQAGIVLKCTLVTRGDIPLAAYEDLSSFKLYYSDTGICTSRTKMTPGMLEEANQFMGGMTENYVAISLRANGYLLNYWMSGGTAEVDFLIIKDDAIIPVECKANLHTKSKSLSTYVNQYNPPYAIRISRKNFGFENNIKSVPLYAVFCI